MKDFILKWIGSFYDVNNAEDLTQLFMEKEYF